jgi:hypothetical protein
MTLFGVGGLVFTKCSVPRAAGIAGAMGGLKTQFVAGKIEGMARQ